MKNFKNDIMPLLEKCKSDAQRLSIILDDIFEANLVAPEEQIPVFWGTVNKYSGTRDDGTTYAVYAIRDLKTLGGTKMNKNPYNSSMLSVFITQNLV